MKPMWPHQLTGIHQTLAHIAAGQKRICLTSPTGGGKTRIMCELARHFLHHGQGVQLYTNRKLLLDQLADDLGEFGFSYGVRAAGKARTKKELLQVASIQTEDSRVHKKQTWEMHDAKLVLLDESHLHSGPQIRRILDAHLQAGAHYVGFTATPLGIGELYDQLVVAGSTSQLRACGALLPCFHFGPDEPDLKGIKTPPGQDLTEKEAVKAIMTGGIFGRVFDHYTRLNPEQKPTILFAPGVQESVWFAEQFVANGISAAHIDGNEVWINGKSYRSCTSARDDALRGSEDGSIKVLCNRFVLREGIDCPWLGHGIFATVFGSVQSYLQSGGRLLRSHPSLRSVTLQDHGGNWWRHGSLNADREWSLEYDSAIVAGLRDHRLRTKLCRRCRARTDGGYCRECGFVNETEGKRCPQCTLILSGVKCPCGYEIPIREHSRPVVQRDGTLKMMHGDIFKPRSVSKRPDGPKLWERMYYRSRTEKGDRTFRAAMALFAYENNFQWPDLDWPLMPVDEHDFFRKVIDVPRERLK